MPFTFRLYEPEADVSFISVVDGEALYNCDEKVGHDAREATLQQIGWHTLRLPEDWFLTERHQDTANRVVETLQCTVQYLHHCQRKAEKALRKATKTLTRYQEERDDAFEEIVTLRETLALYKKRVALAADSGVPPLSRRGGDAKHGDGLVCSLCGNDYPSVHSLESHIKKRHKRADDFAALAAASAGVARRRRAEEDGGDCALQSTAASPLAQDRRQADAAPSSRLVDNLTSEISALRLQVAKLMGEAADQRQAFSPAHLVGMPLGTLPGHAVSLTDVVHRNPRQAPDSAATEAYLKCVTEGLQNAATKMAAMEKTITALQERDRAGPAARQDSALHSRPAVSPQPSATALSSDSGTSGAGPSGVLGILPSSAAITATVQGEASLSAKRRSGSGYPLLLNPSSLAQRRHASVTTVDWDVDVSPMTLVDRTPGGSLGTRPGSTMASRAAPEEDMPPHDAGKVVSPQPAGTAPSVRSATQPTINSVSSSHSSSAVKDASQTGAAGASVATPLVTVLPASVRSDSTIHGDHDQNDVVLTARRSHSLRETLPPPPLPLPATAPVAAPKDRYTLSPGEALSTTVTPRDMIRSTPQPLRAGDRPPSSASAATSSGGGNSSPRGKRTAQTAQTAADTHAAPTEGRAAPQHDSTTTAGPVLAMVPSPGSTPRGANSPKLVVAGVELSRSDMTGPDAGWSPRSQPALSHSPSGQSPVAIGTSYSVPSVVSPSSLLHMSTNRASAPTPPKVQLVQRSHTPTEADASASALSTPASASVQVSPPAVPALVAGRPPAGGLGSPPLGVDSLPHSTVKGPVRQESPLQWNSSDDDKDEVDSDADDDGGSRRRTPPALNAATPLQPPYLTSGDDAATLPAGTLPKLTMLEGPATSGDSTAERPRGRRSASSDRGRADSGSYSYYYTYSATTPSDVRTGADGGIGDTPGVHLIPAVTGIVAETDGASPAPSQSARRRRRSSTPKSTNVADMTRSQAMSQTLTVPPGEEQHTGKVKGVFKSLFTSRKKKK